MFSSDNRPALTLVLTSLTIGALDHSSWFLAYALLLFGFSFLVGFKWPRPVWVWLMILAAGAPAINVAAHLMFGYQAGYSLIEDAGSRFLGAFVAILPGLGVGVLFRRVQRRFIAR
ncbi:MAG: hypothetical protein HY858_06910 [Candidatus Solibacter usitatus]|nr:hypothetical protein [Candidatus Solibacter usitatus]